MKFRSGNEILGFPKNVKFGIEIEAFNTNTKDLYNSKESEKVFKETGWRPDTKETLSHQGGAECVSGILEDTQKTWENLEQVCSHIKKYPGEYGKEVVTDEKCGCHVHFDATEFLENPKMMENFKKLWPEIEELIYKMCNEENDPLRSGAINQKLIPSINLGEPTLKNILSIRTIKQLANLPMQLFNNAVHIFVERRKGFASPIGQKIQKAIEQDKLKVSYKKYGRLTDKILVGMKADPRRYRGLNLANLSSRNKNTFEFRMSNSSLNPDTIKKNVYLYASVLNTARQMTLNPEYKKEEYEKLLKTDVTEKEKLDATLDLLFDEQSDKEIYERRWESVKDAPVFNKNSKKGFAKVKFNRQDYKQISSKVPITKLNEAKYYVQDMLNNLNRGKEYVK